MRYFSILIILLFCLSAGCMKQPAQTSEAAQSADKSTEIQYPESLKKVFDAHGGIDTWKKMRTLSYKLVKGEAAEIHQIDLWSRKDRVEGPNFLMGYDGKDVWLEADTTYKGNAIFYHNLMFYFYAMPFVLGDAGIIYTETEPLVFEGITYPGIRIAFEDGVGVASKDEYILYYHPETFQMAWLRYTATYYSQKRSDKFNVIRYDDWAAVNGVVLPQSLSWYKKENGEPTEPRSKRVFTEIQLSEQPLEDQVFARSEAAKIVN